MWYFAIGSMMLPESYEQRDFHPLESHPAELADFRLGFFSSMGFAEAIPSPGDSMHGVVHRVTEAQMLELDKVEVGYIRLTGNARPYGPKWEQLQSDKTQDNNNAPFDEPSDYDMPMKVSVYCRPDGANKEEDNRPPKERYLEILIAGAKHFGVDPGYIAFLEKHDRQPRTPPDQFIGFGDAPADAQHFTQVPESSDEEGGSLFFSLNGKVIQTVYPANHPHHNYFKHMIQKYGPHFELGMSQLNLDLTYGVVQNIRDCTPQQSSYVEDSHYRYVKQRGELEHYKVIGSFALPPIIENA